MMRRILLTAGFLIGAAGLLCAFGDEPVKVAAPPSEKIVYDEPKAYEEAKTMVVGFKAGDIDETKAVCEKAGLTVVHVSGGTQYVLCKWKDKETLDAALKTLSQRGDLIEFIEPVRSTRLIAPPPPHKEVGAADVSVGPAVAANRADVLPDTTPAWHTNYHAAREEARLEKKPLAIVVGAGMSGWDGVSQDGKLAPAAREYLQDHYVCLYVDTKKEAGRRLADDLEMPSGVGLVLSDRAAEWQKFRHEGPLPEGDLERQLARRAEAPDVAIADPADPPGDPKVPNDEFYAKQWGMENVNAPKAWAVVNSADVVVAVLDTGVFYDHPDLKANMFVHTGKNFKDNKDYPNVVGFDYGSGVDPATNAYKKDFVGLPDPKFVNFPVEGGHGTHCTGIVGAVGDNKIGVAGVCWKTKLMALQIFTVLPPGSLSNPGNKAELRTFNFVSADAIHYAVDNGAKVLSNSYGGPGTADPLVEKEIKRANDKGVLFVASAGNDAVNIDDKPAFPADYEQPNVLTVAAINRNDQLSDFGGGAGSNFGKKHVHIAAPGGQEIVKEEDGVLSTFPPDVEPNKQQYHFFQGTSQACPHVAGAAALAYGLPAFKDLKPEEMKKLLMDKARKLPVLQDKVASGGTLDLSFLGEAAPPPVTCEPCFIPCWEPCPPCWEPCPRHGRLFGRRCR